ncbi:hypothetical protein FHC49_13415 [Kluyvera sp. EC_51]|uniref:hypothetical protein n=1 Tax=Kluyvera sp. EC_51 TaxID=2584089 RepID=UPI001C703168|nr:hypothetical protein [Kluyvera sp. EC_51]MBW9462323.1 hypothetical protein [Kluyvera sp. EC_51]
MGRLPKTLLISFLYTAIAIVLDAIAIFYFKLNAPITVIVTTFLVLSILSFEYVDATRRSERNFAERRKAEAQGFAFSLIWDALDSDAKQRFYQLTKEDGESSELSTKYQRLQNDVRYWEKEIDRLR